MSFTSRKYVVIDVDLLEGIKKIWKDDYVSSAFNVIINQGKSLNNVMEDAFDRGFISSLENYDEQKKDFMNNYIIKEYDFSSKPYLALNRKIYATETEKD